MGVGEVGGVTVGVTVGLADDEEGLARIVVRVDNDPLGDAAEVHAVATAKTAAQAAQYRYLSNSRPPISLVGYWTHADSGTCQRPTANW